MAVKVFPSYGAINCARDLGAVWVELWSGDEWGEVMGSLIHTIHSDYGLSDDDLAILAEMLWRNLEWQKQWMDDEGYQYEYTRAHEAANDQARCREIRDEYLKNEERHPTMLEPLKQMLATIPDWVFGESDA